MSFGGERLGWRSERNEPSFVQKSDFGGGGVGICGVVRDKDRLDVMFAKPALQPREQGIAGRAIERGKGFIEEEQPGERSECPRESDALCLSTGEMVRVAMDQSMGANQVAASLRLGRSGCRA